MLVGLSFPKDPEGVTKRFAKGPNSKVKASYENSQGCFWVKK